jgi:circadian clock protein KaiC
LLQRVPSGIPGLDPILHGGFLRSGLYLIAGAPGTGKTILGNQIAVHHATTGGRVVFASLLSETHTRLFAHLSSFSFFAEPVQAQLVGDALFYISGYSVLQSEGLPGLRTVLQGAIRDRQATLLILDGILNAEAFAAEREFKEFLRGLQQFAEASGCTVLLLASRGTRGAARDHVALDTTVDGVIELRRLRRGMRAVRELEVAKLRGTASLPGGHVFDISAHGIVVYPRTEALLAGTGAALPLGAAPRERTAFGIAGLDDMLRGGVFRGSTTALLGPPGSGKTVLGLHFLAEGARHGESGLYFGLHEPPAVLLDVGDHLGLEFSRWVNEGRIEVVWHLAGEVDPDVLAQQLLERVRARQVQRVFLDGLDAFSDLHLDAGRSGPFFTALTTALRALGVTTLTTVELTTLFGPTVAIPVAGVSALVENILFLRYVELRSQLYRLISVLKARRSGHDLALREFTIDAQGITIARTFQSAEAILTGLARPLPGMAEQAPEPNRSTLPLADS